MKIKNIIFDMDGTILNTLDDICDSVNYMMSECGYDNLSIETVRGYVGNGIKKLVERCMPLNATEKDFNDAYNIFSAHYDKNKNNKTAPYEGIIDAMDTLAEEGIQMAVVSNKYDAGVKELAKLFKSHLRVAIGESEKVFPKPSPDGVWLAMSELGATQADTVYIGDSEVDAMTAYNSGVPFIAVTWGFRSQEELADSNAVAFATTPKEILEIIRSM